MATRRRMRRRLCAVWVLALSAQCCSPSPGPQDAALDVRALDRAANEDASFDELGPEVVTDAPSTTDVEALDAPDPIEDVGRDATLVDAAMDAPPVDAVTDVARSDGPTDAPPTDVPGDLPDVPADVDMLCPSRRYVILDRGVGVDGDGTGRVLDTRTGLIWARYVYFPGSAPFTVEAAAAYCRAVGARIPTYEEVLGIANENADFCVWPRSWQTVTSTPSRWSNLGVYVVDQTLGEWGAAIGSTNSRALCVR